MNINKIKQKTKNYLECYRLVNSTLNVEANDNFSQNNFIAIEM